MGKRKKGPARSRAHRSVEVKLEETNGLCEETSLHVSDEKSNDKEPVVDLKTVDNIGLDHKDDILINGDITTSHVKSSLTGSSLQVHEMCGNRHPVVELMRMPQTFDLQSLQPVLERLEQLNTFSAIKEMKSEVDVKIEPAIEQKINESCLGATYTEAFNDLKLEDECVSTDTTGSESSMTGNAIRRSTRIRHIGIMKQKVRSQTASPDQEKPVKVKSRWRRSSELETTVDSPPRRHGYPKSPSVPKKEQVPETEDQLMKRLEQERVDVAEGLKKFQRLTDNEYHTERNACKAAKKMDCDCVLSKEEMAKGIIGCSDDCLNRMLFLECGQRCALGDRCGNKRFQKRTYVDSQIFKTEKKGFGLKALKPIPGDTFIMEYVGEVVDQDEFSRRVKAYAKSEVKHFYFMSLKGDTVIDATSRGNISRFINHSCDPNAETQKWTVNGELRIGFFSRRPIQAGEEITFDYRFQRYGKEAQKCYCEAPLCRGWIGESRDDDDDDDDEDEDEDEEEEEEDEEDEESPEEEEDEQKPDVSTEETAEDLKNEVSTSCDLDVEIDAKPIKKVKPRRVKKVVEVVDDKVRKTRGRGAQRRNLESPVVEDLGLEEELQRLTITGLKNRAHTLMLSRLMVRAEDWLTRCRLLEMIRSGDEPCRRLFLDYQGLRFLHAWMQSTITDTTDCDERRLEIMKTLQSLPIPNKTMLIESKVLDVVENWRTSNKIATILSPDADSGESVDSKVATNAMAVDTQIFEQKHSPAESASPNSTPKVLTGDVDSSSSTEKAVPETAVEALAGVILAAWAPLKEVFKIPKKERMEQLKEHEREADRGYRQSSAPYTLDNFYSRNKIDRERDSRPRLWDRTRERKLSRDSPPSDPDWLRNSRRMTKHERRHLFTLQVLQEEEAARHRMQQEDMWVQHQARCEALGIDPQINPSLDPISGCPIFFDQSTRCWSSNPPPSPYLPPYATDPGYSNNYLPMYPMGPPNGVTTALPYPMLSYVNGPTYLTPSPGMPLTPSYQPNPRFATPQNIIPLTPDPSLSETDFQSEQISALPPDAPVVTQVPLNTPMKLPPKWKTAKDPRGFVYYYHVKHRKSQWDPPSWTEDEARIEAERTLAGEEESSSESSETESEDDDEEIENVETETPDYKIAIGNIADTTQPEEDIEEPLCAESEDEEEEAEEVETATSPVELPSQSDEIEAADDDEEPEIETPVPTKSPYKRRKGLVEERIISPRSESSRSAMRKYKEAKLLIRKRKEERKAEKAKQKMKKRRREKRVTSAAADTSTDKKIKEMFKSKVATSVVGQLNYYRKSDCKSGRITNNEDFKHLARKLTHIVMLKELKHCKSVDDLECNESVKGKAKDFVKKYMTKFGEEYEPSP